MPRVFLDIACVCTNATIEGTPSIDAFSKRIPNVDNNVALGCKLSTWHMYGGVLTMSVTAFFREMHYPDVAAFMKSS